MNATSAIPIMSAAAVPLSGRVPARIRRRCVRRRDPERRPGIPRATPAPTSAMRSHITRTIGTRNGFSRAPATKAPTRRRADRAESPEPLKPVREQEERPGQHRERERRPAADRAAERGERSNDAGTASSRKEEEEDAGGDREQPVDYPQRVGEHRARGRRARSRRRAATHGTNGANLDFGSAAPSRTAAIGGTRVARIAGKRPARSVMPMPTTDDDRPGERLDRRSEALHRDSRRAPDPLGQDDAQPEAGERREKPDHERFEDHRSEDLASRRSDRPQCANSRVRCATVIENVLKMTKPPTKSAMKPNVRRKYLKIVVNSLRRSPAPRPRPSH